MWENHVNRRTVNFLARRSERFLDRLRDYELRGILCNIKSLFYFKSLMFSIQEGAFVNCLSVERGLTSRRLPSICVRLQYTESFESSFRKVNEWINHKMYLYFAKNHLEAIRARI